MDSVVASEAIDPGSTPGIRTMLRRRAAKAKHALRSSQRSRALFATPTKATHGTALLV